MNSHRHIDQAPLPLLEPLPRVGRPRAIHPAHAACGWSFTSLSAFITRHRLLLLGLTFVLALAIRLVGLDASGFSDDEMNKVQAVAAYRAGQFDANAEHPMLMKLLMLASTAAVDGWNGTIAAALALPPIAPETALRLPNAAAGAATTLVLFLLVELFFDTHVALAAALFWALDVNATGINRIGKEDSLLLFFLLLGAWLYERGKHTGRQDPSRAQRWYVSSGAAFGLMLASKYMPHYFGLYALFNQVSDPVPGANKPRKRWFYAALAAAFLIGNAAILMPEVWRYILGYVGGQTLEHHGYLYAHELYTNDVSHSPWGLPVTFYLVFLLTKVPLTALGMVGLGVGEMWRRSRERGVIFLRIFIVLVLLPYSLVASKFLRYMLPVLAMLDIVAALGLVWLVRRIALGAERGRGSPGTVDPLSGLQRFNPLGVTPPASPFSRSARLAAALAVAAIALGGPLLAQRESSPFPSLFQNVIGRAVSGGLLFPDDELYDFGVREAVARIASDARPNAVVASEAPAVTRWYLDAAGRPDIVSTRLSDAGVPAGGADGWVIAQDAHLYYENAPTIAWLRDAHQPWARIMLRAHTAVELFRLPGTPAGGPGGVYHTAAR